MAGKLGPLTDQTPRDASKLGDVRPMHPGRHPRPERAVPRPVHRDAGRNDRPRLGDRGAGLPGRIVRRSRLQPGKMLLLDLQQKRIVPDSEIKAAMSRRKPYRKWVKDNKIELRGLFVPSEIPPKTRRRCGASSTPSGTPRRRSSSSSPRWRPGGRRRSARWGTTPRLRFSNRPQSLFAYFKQLFAQVTNPPIDPLREERRCP